MAEQETVSGREEFLQRWSSLGRSRQVVAIVLVVAVIIFVVMLAQFFFSEQYVVLYSNLDPDQASPIVQHLREGGVPYELEDFGSTIKVPAERADELRIEMAGEGEHFAQGVGFELFDEVPMGITDFERQVKLQRALQEELRRTITSLDGVNQARVHLALPEERVFLEEKVDPSASIYLRVNPFETLEETQVKGIANLVASGVEELAPANVTVVDEEGKILFDGVKEKEGFGDSFSASADDRMEIRRNFERELEQRLQGILEQVFGPGRALAMVNADLDFDAHEVTEISYEEGEGIPRSSHVIEESYEGEAPDLEEVGEANYPGYAGAFPGGEGEYERREETFNYEIGETKERTISAPGEVVNLNTSVVVDSGGNPLGEEDIEQVRELVSSAVGFDEERGDQISVEGMNFDTGAAEEAEKVLAQMEAQQRQEEMFRQAVLGAAALLAAILILVAIKRRRRLREEREYVAAEGPTLDELLAAQEEEPEAPQEEPPQKKIKEMVEKNPEVAASVLRTWMSEE